MSAGRDRQPLAGGAIVGGSEFAQWWQIARQQATAAAVPHSELDWLLQTVAGLDRLTLRLEAFGDRVRLNLPLTELDWLWQQRLQQRVPVQYLAGVAPWRQFELRVSPAVLIPRPETECLIDLAVALAAGNHTGHWADLGTGSGAIALGLAAALPLACIHAVDVSAAALAIAQDNAALHGLTDRIQFYQGSWFEPLAHLTGRLQGMVANPPYIPSQEVLQLQPEVVQHEPHLALDGGPDGLAATRQLATLAPRYLQRGGIWLVELMRGQAGIVADLLDRREYCNIEIHADLAGIDRFVRARRR